MVQSGDPNIPLPAEHIAANEKHKGCTTLEAIREMQRAAGGMLVDPIKIAYINIPVVKKGKYGETLNRHRTKRIGLFCARCKAFWPNIYHDVIEGTVGTKDNADDDDRNPGIFILPGDTGSEG